MRSTGCGRFRPQRASSALRRPEPGRHKVDDLTGQRTSVSNITDKTVVSASIKNARLLTQKLFPRQEYRRAFDLLCERLSDRQACKITVELLALAHDRGCEGELAGELARVLGTDTLPDIAALRRKFAPDPAELPVVSVRPVSLGSYEALVRTAAMAGARA